MDPANCKFIRFFVGLAATVLYLSAAIYGQKIKPDPVIRAMTGEVSAKSIETRGGELQGMTKNLAESRNEAMNRLLEEARKRGGNTIVAMRFDTTELGDVWTEICAYGTAVQAVPVTEAAKYTAQQLGYGGGG